MSASSTDSSVTPARSLGQRLVILVPYLWLAAFFLLPFGIVLKISLSETALAQPPYVPLLDLSAGWDGIKAFLGGLSLDRYGLIFSDSLYLSSYLRSLEVATLSTLMLLAIGYPIAYAVTRMPARTQGVLVLLIVLPFWTSFLIRVYAWINILQHDGLLNQALLALGLVSEPIAFLATDKALYIGLVYSYLPFMVLPIYATLVKLDDTLLEAAADLGCRRWQAFWWVTLPLSLPGVAAGVLLCFIPIVGEFVAPDLLGGSVDPMVGQTLWTEFFANKDWPVASAIAVTLLLLLGGPILIYQHLQARNLRVGP
ncbi:MAG: Putrescine transport system permease protein PotH [Xanthobacteraceae bacterium]|jgi:putrescine transport system permease protein|nr:Putrescine transport system permease protein PotH [Xanthobacteraceae bacterium]